MYRKSEKSENMMGLCLLIIVLSIWEIRYMRRKRLVKEMIVFGCIAVIALLLGGLTLLGPYKSSLVKLLGLKY